MSKFMSFLWRHPILLFLSLIVLFLIFLSFFSNNPSGYLGRNTGSLLPFVLLALFFGWLGKGIGRIYQPRIVLLSPIIATLFPLIVQIALPFTIIALIVIFNYKQGSSMSYILINLLP
jgi:hypothetical protein